MMLTVIIKARDDAGLLIVGVDVEAEGNDRSSLDLPGHQNDLLRDAYTYGKISASLCHYFYALFCSLNFVSPHFVIRLLILLRM